MKRFKRLEGNLGKIVVIVLFLFGLAGQALASTYYVSPTGSDSSSGSSSAPFKTIQKAAGIVNPGDTVIVKNGTYTDTNGDDKVVNMNRGGTSSAWITFKAENKWGAVIDCQNNATQYGFTSNSANSHHIVIEGFEIKGCDEAAIHWNLGESYITIKGNHIHDIGRHTDNTLYGFPATHVDGDHITFDSNVFHTIGRFNPGTTPSGSTASCTTPSNYVFKGESYPNLNVCYNHDHAIYGTDGNYLTVINNVFYDLKSGWAIINTGGTGHIVMNNTFVGDNPGREGQINARGTSWSVQNNIFYNDGDCGVETAEDSGGTIRYNILYPSIKAQCGSDGSWTSSNNLSNQNPLFVSSASNNYHLQSGSPAINRGIDIAGYDYDADGKPIVGAPDIGAYEYSGSTASPSSPSTDTTPPSTPTGLAATAASTSQINLSWTASTDNTGVSGYKVYRGTALIATTANRNYSDTGLSAATTYTYKVSAYDAAGNASAFSGAVSATTKASTTTSPATPPTTSKVIIDNGGSGTSYMGQWRASGATNPYGSNSLYGRDGATYTWNAGLPKTGSYDVYIWWTAYSSRSSSVPVTVTYSGGSKTVYVNQRDNGGQWNYLGTFSFDASKGGTVKLSAPDPHPVTYSADAVKFVAQ